MKSRLQSGSSDLTGIVILAVLILIIIVSPKNPTPARTDNGVVSGFALSSSNQSTGGTASSPQIASSAYSREVSVGSGNAPYAYQSYEEYITIDNQGRSAVDITGWQLKNGKDKRPVYQSGILQRFSADIALIPQATLLLSPKGNSLLQDVVLNQGDKAIITTGSVGVHTPYNITSFKENMCTGYIEALPDYAFSPALNQNCPRPYVEPGVENLDAQCRSFIGNISSCRTPVFDAKTPDGKGPCSTCVNGQLLNSSCAAFVKEHFSYKGCVANHASDSNFSGHTWRIFLGRGWEMWAKEYETIELYDRLGQLVNFQNY